LVGVVVRLRVLLLVLGKQVALLLVMFRTNLKSRKRVVVVNPNTREYKGMSEMYRVMSEMYKGMSEMYKGMSEMYKGMSAMYKGMPATTSNIIATFHPQQPHQVESAAGYSESEHERATYKGMPATTSNIIATFHPQQTHQVESAAGYSESEHERATYKGMPATTSNIIATFHPQRPPHQVECAAEYSLLAVSLYSRDLDQPAMAPGHDQRRRI
jgi:hypothetical protein